MNQDLVFLAEEESMAMTLEVLISNLGYSTESCRIYIIHHQGSKHLRKSIPNKLRGWKHAHFVILHDQDSKNCKELKKELIKLCQGTDKEEKPIIRIVCRELESWFLGDPNAIRKAFGKDFSDLNHDKYNDPDSIKKPSEELKGLIEKQGKQSYKKVKGAKLIAEHMEIKENQNRYKSFQVFMKTIEELLPRFCSSV